MNFEGFSYDSILIVVTDNSYIVTAQRAAAYTFANACINRYPGAHNAMYLVRALVAGRISRSWHVFV